MNMRFDEAVRLLAGGRPGLRGAAEALSAPGLEGRGSPRIIDVLLDGFPERVRAAHGVPRCALFQAARMVLVATALVRSGTDKLSQDGARLAEDLVNGAARTQMRTRRGIPAEMLVLPRTWGPAPARELTDHYVQLARPLAAACPEFALAVGLRAGIEKGTEDGDGTGLAKLGAMLARFAGQANDAGSTRSRLNDPIAELGSRGPRLPSLADGYVNPRFRLAGPDLAEGSTDKVASDKWWEEQRVQDDIERFLAAYLITLPALGAPLVVLGHPGAGKSLLTKLLAARLPAAEYRPLRVELRRTPAEAALQAQLEHALEQETGRAVSWPDWSESVPGAIPVLLLDGFDELLQAGAQLLDSARQWRYLRQIEQFQKREASQGRPLIVIVTSRTVVADRAQLPTHSPVLRLEPFGEAEIEHWLAIWNTTNAPYFAEHGLHPLALGPVLQHAELAAQPLLLMMLALYDTVTGDLHRLRYESINRAQLYERLLTRFVRRQVVKDGPLPVAEQDAAIERELHRLSVIALGMLHRGTQAITGEQADGDLRTLAPEASGQEPHGAEPLFGRFFFVHEAQAVVSDQHLRSYEFLHATFGEHLAARLIDRALRKLAESEAVDDGELYALLSFTPLTDRAQLVQNLRDMLAGWPADGHRDRLPTLLAGLFRAAQWDPPYRTDPGHAPTAATMTYRKAVYEANLLLIAVLAAGEVYASALLESADLVDGWRRRAMLWQSQLSAESWDLLSSTLHLERCGREGEPDLRIGTRRVPLVQHELSWQLGVPDVPSGSRHMLPEEGAPSDISDTVRRVMFVGDRDAELLLHAAHPLLHQLPSTLRSYELDEDGFARSAAHSLMALLSRDWYDPAVLPDLYARCLRHLGHLPQHGAEPYLEAVVRQLGQDAQDLPDRSLLAVARQLSGVLDSGMFLTAAGQRSLLDFVHAVLGRGGPQLAEALNTLQMRVYASATAAEDDDEEYLNLLLRLTRFGRSSGTWEGQFPVPRGAAAVHLLDGLLTRLDLRETAARHPSAVVDLLRLAADLGLDDWLAKNAARILAALSAPAFALLRPTDLHYLRAALPDGAYTAEFTKLELVWRERHLTPPAGTPAPRSPAG
ncbi:hypothetical protein [Streptomyces sp. NPDC007205]|uniref:NACHT domain-containing protein n=1 Tax=Streptomyces sp. NPDC007205 TaxID=3154316 RepID=UPI0033FFF40F